MYLFKSNSIRYIINRAAAQTKCSKRLYCTFNKGDGINWNQSWSVKEFLNVVEKEEEAEEKMQGDSIVSRDKLLHLADLAMLNVPESKVDEYCKDLKNILASVDAIQVVDTQSIKPLHSVLEDHYINLHKEGTSINNDHETILQHAPATHGGFYTVPKQRSSTSSKSSSSKSSNHDEDDF
ncbi:hypothetical protein CYY_007820 [Polysphondylium violaceum]|uniref:Glutamyl-tRNA(Gln) amidotransferase subunit C, mitochondrial n=1 Tax=Polysphondylium violaceum TaxID=133409 RepID=A0A8J4PRB9_9MYCE|nr:hypothetical protein CYY_007820 [Polysphondylium violaceum]